MGDHVDEKEPNGVDLFQPTPLSCGPFGRLVERFFTKIKQCPRVATRYDKFAANCLVFIQLAAIGLSLRVNESAP